MLLSIGLTAGVTADIRPCAGMLLLSAVLAVLAASGAPGETPAAALWAAPGAPRVCRLRGGVARHCAFDEMLKRKAADEVCSFPTQ